MKNSFKLLEVFGIELEYMVVDQTTFDVKPVVDKLFVELCGKPSNVVESERIDWSNELVNHVVEFKNKKPEPEILPLIPLFQEQVRRANQALKSYGAQLMPSAVHPWMNPDKETKLWPYENNEIYSAYDRIFGCKGHGWSNLQSLHINISFDSDQEFHSLHSAIRAFLPLIPALSTSSPFIDGEKTQYKSNRLAHYLKNQRRIPSIIGLAVPEVMHSRAEYQEKVLQPMYDDIAPFDPQGDLQEEWLNSRGAIPKFERGCVEIRLSDVQEAPFVDLSIAHLWKTLILQLIDGKKYDLSAFDKIETSKLREILNETVLLGEEALISEPDYLKAFGLSKPVKAQELLTHIVSNLPDSSTSSEWQKNIGYILQNGSLSTRLLRHYQAEHSRDSLKEIAKALCLCLQEGKFFEA